MRLSAFCLCILAVGRLFAGEPSPEDVRFFEQMVEPILATHCFACHSHDKKIKGGLALDSKSGWEAGGESGAAVIVPHKPDESPLIQAVRRTGEPAMPPEKALPPEAVAALVEWVQRGAVDPRRTEARIGGMTAEDARRWWAFQPLPQAALPDRTLDELIERQATAANVSLAPPADKRTLLRRATFDLTGLPPTPEQTAAFLADDAPDAFAKVVNRLLDSPQYGEKWGRHWLDVVRYADSFDARGFGGEGDIAEAWRYRDWVVNAFNRDLPYDQFMVRQLAGDILAARESSSFDPDLIVATGMFAIGNWGNGDADKEKLYTDIVDDQVDVVGRAFLGMTIACARCHDHKFDPLTTKDYYGLAGMFFSSRILTRFAAKTAGENPIRIPLASSEELARREQAARRVAEIDAILAQSSQPLSEIKRKTADLPGLVSRFGKAADNPSVTVNTRDSEAVYSTIKLPAKSIAVHPGPKTPVVIEWRSPVAGVIRVTASFQDVDPNCGDGITWAVRHAGRTAASGEMSNGGRMEMEAKTLDVAKDDTVRLVLGPRGEYTCDSTRIELSIRAADGTTWSVQDALLKDADGESVAPDANGIVAGVWRLTAGEGAPSGQSLEQTARLQEEKQQLSSAAAKIPQAHGLQEGGILGSPYEGFRDVRVHVRGSYTRLGDLVPRSLPAVLPGGGPTAIPAGSGRWELSQWLSDPKNPLPARVMANRIWQHHFGEGLVRTPNNFGKLGTPPSHPELLDRLAAEFVASGWSIKHMHRRIMQSAAYQRASVPAVPGQDPENRNFARQNRRRLSAEELRDTMLAAANKLDRTAGGVSVRDLLSSRRTLYVTTIRSDRATYQALFDGADAGGVVEKRTDTVVAPQSLWLLNHPFALAQVKTLAELTVAEPGDRGARVQRLFQRLFQRPADAAELALAARAVTEPDHARGWEAFCQVLLCSNEFAYVD